jgi:putative transposase
MDGYNRGGHTKYSLTVHMVLPQSWKRQILWSDGYFACSIGQVSQKTIEHYIQNQG